MRAGVAWYDSAMADGVRAGALGLGMPRAPVPFVCAVCGLVDGRRERVACARVGCQTDTAQKRVAGATSERDQSVCARASECLFVCHGFIGGAGRGVCG